jgi:hypothetical protein
MYTGIPEVPSVFKERMTEAHEAFTSEEYNFAELLYSMAVSHATTDRERASALYMKAFVTSLQGFYDESISLSHVALCFAVDDVDMQRRMWQLIGRTYMRWANKAWFMRTKRKFSKLADEAFEKGRM